MYSKLFFDSCFEDVMWAKEKIRNCKNGKIIWNKSEQKMELGQKLPKSLRWIDETQNVSGKKKMPLLLYYLVGMNINKNDERRF